MSEHVAGVEIPLTRGHVALVDADDYAELARFKWHAIKPGRVTYAARDGRKSDGTRVKILMHREILAGVERVDHVNGDGLDNRRANLRPATHAENQRNARRRATNTSGFIGVGWHASAKKWRARVQVDGRAQHLGLFDNAEDAARARDEVAVRLHGPFARLNFPGGISS